MTAPKHHCSRGDLHGGMGQNTSNSVWKPCEVLQKTFDRCHCQQRVYKVLRWNFVIDQILIFHHNLQINSLQNPTMWFSGFSFLILSLIVEVYLWWKLQASLVFLSGRTCTIGGWLNTFLPHCMYTLVTLYFKVSLLQCNYTFKYWVILINYMYYMVRVWFRVTCM